MKQLLIFILLAGQAIAGVFLDDNFTGTDATAVESHAGEVAGTWIENAAGTGAGQLSANRLYSTAAGNSIWRSAAVPTGADYSVSATVRYMSGASDFGVCGRVDHEFRYAYWAGYLASTGKWTLLKRVNTGLFTGTGMGTPYTQSLVAGTDYTVKLDMSGSSITLYVDGVSRVTATNSEVTGVGTVALYLGGAGSTTTGMHCDRIFAEQSGNDPFYGMNMGFIVDGDSLNTDFSRTGTTTLSMLLTDATRWNSGRAWNIGVPGQTATQMNADNAAQFAAIIPAMEGYNKKIVVIEAGINDLAASETSATVLTRLTTAVTTAKSAGAEVCICTITPATSITAGKETARLAVNVGILAGDTGANYVADAAGLAHAANPADTTYYVDGVHWTVALQTEVGDLIVAAVPRIYRSSFMQ